MTFPNFTEKLEVKLEPEPEIGTVNHHGGNQNHDHHNNLDSDNLLEHLDDIMGDVINDEDLGTENLQFHIKTSSQASDILNIPRIIFSHPLADCFELMGCLAGRFLCSQNVIQLASKEYEKIIFRSTNFTISNPL